MKSVLHFGLLASFVLLAACAKKDDSSPAAPPAVATTPNQPCNIPGQSNCDPSIYNQYNQYGWMTPEPYQWTNNNGRCGCPVGYLVTRNPSWGYGCLRASAFGYGYSTHQQPYLFFNFQAGFNHPGQQYGGYPGQQQGGYPGQYNGQQQQFIPPAQNGQYLNIPQSNYQPVISGTGNCSVSAASACDIRNANSCGPNATCRVVGGGSTLGLCTSGLGQDYYSDRCSPFRYNRNGYNYVYWSCGGNYYDYAPGNGGQNPYGTPR